MYDQSLWSLLQKTNNLNRIQEISPIDYCLNTDVFYITANYVFCISSSFHFKCYKYCTFIFTLNKNLFKTDYTFQVFCSRVSGSLLANLLSTIVKYKWFTIPYITNNYKVIISISKFSRILFQNNIKLYFLY